ncbi:MAG TPA: hypothetical protein VH912_06585 [Streptosporangiaceae bacterium]
MMLRHRIADRLREVTPTGDEKLLEALLTDIVNEIESDIDHQKLQAEDPRGLLAAVEAWASVASDVVAGFHSSDRPEAPKSVGLSPAVANTLRQITDQLRTPLGHAAKELDAMGYAISVGTPAAPLAVTLTWPVPPRVP